MNLSNKYLWGTLLVPTPHFISTIGTVYILGIPPNITSKKFHFNPKSFNYLIKLLLF